MKYLWTEDSGAGFHFWQLVNENLFNGGFIVESKGNNQKLLEAVRALKPKAEEVYYIAFDIVYDNMDVMNKYLELRTLAKKYSDNIILLDITCFEAIILSFKNLVDWTGTGRKDKIEMRKIILAALNNHKIDIDYIDDTKTLNYLMGFKYFSTEKVIKSITNELTDKDEWSVKGTMMGRCWHQDCCVLKNVRKKLCNVPEAMGGRNKIMCLLKDGETQRIVKDIL